MDWDLFNCALEITAEEYRRVVEARYTDNDVRVLCDYLHSGWDTNFDLRSTWNFLLLYPEEPDADGRITRNSMLRINRSKVVLIHKPLGQMPVYVFTAYHALLRTFAGWRLEVGK